MECDLSLSRIFQLRKNNIPNALMAFRGSTGGTSKGNMNCGSFPSVINNRIFCLNCRIPYWNENIFCCANDKARLGIESPIGGSIENMWLHWCVSETNLKRVANIDEGVLTLKWSYTSSYKFL